MNRRSIYLSLRFFLLITFSFSLALGQFSPALAALRCYVKAGASGANTGASWADAYTSLQSGLANAACTEIWVAKGTYKPTPGPDRAISFVLKNGVALYGGFAGTETLLSQRNPGVNPTILSGNIGDLALATDNSYHVVVGSGTNNTAILDGFTITAGNGNGTSFNGNGGGMFNDTGSPTLANLIFTGNSSGDGGALKNVTSNPVLTNITFSGNSAGGGSGGGISNVQSNPSLTNVTFSSNSAGYGGGMNNYLSSPTLVNVTFFANSASFGGGGMFNDENSNATLTNATFFLNVASVLQDGGGAILISASSLTIKNSILYADIGIGGELRIINAGSAAIAYSIVQGGYAGTGNLNANPLLGSLGSYGGPTQTMLPGPGSPAIDSGTNTGCPGTDQRGMIRPQDGNGDGITICDMGATEVRVASASGTCYVSANAVSGFNDGTSWADAFISLQSALGTPACTQVWVAKGTYKPTANTDRTVSFALHSGMAVYGGFAGVETLLVQRNPAANPTILSGEIGAAGNTDNSYHVVVGSGTSTTARLDGFTITAGNAAGAAWPNTAGGGMYNASGSPSLANLTFSGNLAAESGGGMANQASSPTLTSVTFSANSAIAGGGGMYNYSASIPKLTNVTFSGNSTTGAGGAILNNGSSPKLTNVTISGNSAAAGGAIKNAASSSPVIKNSILHGDTGGEISNSSSTPSVTYSLIQGGYPGTGNLNANPLLKPLGNYGGPTKTMLLNYGSPAIDKGTNTGCPLKDQRGVTRPLDGDGNTIATCDMGATEAAAVVLLMKSFRSAGALDGWVLESAETSGLGGTLDAAADTLSVGDGTLDRQGRSILSFDTSSLPDSAVITSATLKIMKAGLVGVDPFTTLGNLLVDVRKGPFSNNLALQLTDFQAPASKNAALTILNNPINGWYAKAMPPVNLVYINKVGLTQFRLRFQLDDNDNGVADYLKFYSGNAAFASTRPVLILKYYLP